MRWREKVLRLNTTRRLAEVIAFMGGLLFLIQSWGYAHTQTSIMDEGDYLYKGFLFVSGKYWPYQDYGPWTNHMPLSFWIFGTVQKWFGFGVRTGRYFAVGLGVLMMLGLWIITRRVGGRWWAVLALWAVTLNPMLVKIYSIGISQGLIACLLMWMMVLALGEGRSQWQLILGSVIAGVLLLTRINMAPVLPILLLYIWWQQGLKGALPAILAGLLTVLIGHAIFWPEILRLWGAWLPHSLTPFLEPWWENAGGEPFWNPISSLRIRFESFLSGVRLYFVAFLAACSAWLTWPTRSNWRKESQYKTAVFLSVLFGALLIFHAWASLGLDYCVYCFRRYLGFFAPVGFVLVASMLRFSLKKLSRTRQITVLSTLVVFYVVYMQSNTLRGTTLRFIDDFLNMQVPRIRSMRILPGSAELWLLFANKFGIRKGTLYSLGALVVSLLIALLFIGAIHWVNRLFKRINLGSDYPLASRLLITLFALGLFLSPTEALGGGYHSYDCSGDVIASYEEVGQHLAATIPEGATVFWKGSNAFAPLLYIPDVRIFPAMLNGDYTFRIGGDSELLPKYGLWNEELAGQWWMESDYLLIEERFYKEWTTETYKLKDGEKFYPDLVRTTILSGAFVDLEPTVPVFPCQPDSRILIFMKQP
jgi:hypothetical protein